MIGRVNTGGGTGGTLMVTAPAWVTVTVSKDGKTKTKTAGADGVAVFKGLKSGQWTLTITDGEQTAQKTVTITADYFTAITFFSATIHVTYPAGSTCTATDGVTTLTAPDTSGTWDCVVPNAGTWTVSVIEKSWSASAEITENGQEVSVDVSKYWLYKSGNKYEERTGGWTEIKAGNGIITWNADSVYLGYQATTSRYASIHTSNAIDVGDHTKLCARISGVTISGDRFIFGLRSSPYTGTTASQAGTFAASCTLTSSNSDEQTLEIDISGLANQQLYAQLIAGVTNVYVYEIYLSK